VADIRQSGEFCEETVKPQNAANFVGAAASTSNRSKTMMFRLKYYDWTFSSTAEAVTALLLVTAIAFAVFS
jgi:hypothetical protein